MTTAFNKTEDGTITLTITLSWDEVKKAWDEVVEEMVKNANLPGFRKGKAPKKLVEEKLDKAKVREEVLKKLLPQAYVNAIKEHNLKPIIDPRIHVHELKDDSDWQFEAITCEAPEVKLNDYKDRIKKVTAKEKIVIPGKEPQKTSFDEIVKTLLESVQITIPKILIDQEVERLLSHTLDDIKKLGLTLDQYLQSTGRTSESLKSEYEQKATNDLKLEFALAKIAEEENITVSDKEIEEAIAKAKNDEERKNLEANRYLLASILRQQKTLDLLRSL